MFLLLAVALLIFYQNNGILINSRVIDIYI